jgi:hypothetical protein
MFVVEVTYQKSFRGQSGSTDTERATISLKEQEVGHLT